MTEPTKRVPRDLLVEAMFAKVGGLFRGDTGRYFAGELADAALAALEAAPGADAGRVSGDAEVKRTIAESLRVQGFEDAARTLERAPDADAGRVAELGRRLAQMELLLAEARGHNGAGVGEKPHAVHPDYGPCDAFGDGGSCAMCQELFGLHIATLERRIERALEMLSPILSVGLSADSAAFRRGLEARVETARAILRGDSDG